jgi:acetyl esterase/lipase
VNGEWVSTGEAPGQGVVLFFHGGGFVMGSPATHRSGTWRIARATGRRVLAIRYRHAPDHAFPAWVEDGVAAFRWLLDQGIPPEKILVAGDSAGGNMALAVTHRLRAENVALPAALILFSPWGDLACGSPSYRRNAHTEAMFRAVDVRATGAFLTAACDPRHPEVSPVHADLKGFPPTLIFAGSGELFVDDARMIRRNAIAAGVKAELHVYRYMPHVFPFLAGVLPRAKPAYGTITRFVSELPAF